MYPSVSLPPFNIITHPGFGGDCIAELFNFTVAPLETSTTSTPSLRVSQSAGRAPLLWLPPPESYRDDTRCVISRRTGRMVYTIGFYKLKTPDNRDRKIDANISRVAERSAIYLCPTAVPCWSPSLTRSIRSFRPLPTLKNGSFFGGTGIFSPVLGLRPS